MSDHTTEPDYGTGHKTLGVYLIGVIACVLLTIVAFWAVLSGDLSRATTFSVIYLAAVTQFFVQIIFFLRLNLKTVQGQWNVMAFAYTLLILLCIIIGSLWIMSNLNYYMVH